MPDPSKIDWAYWKSHMAKRAEKRFASLKPPTPFIRDENEPEGTMGSNDSLATAESVRRFGTPKRKHQAVGILGDLFAPDIEAPDLATTEDQGSITLATDTGTPQLRMGRDHQRDRRRTARQCGHRQWRLRLLQGDGNGRTVAHRQHGGQRPGHGCGYL